MMKTSFRHFRLSRIILKLLWLAMPCSFPRNGATPLPRVTSDAGLEFKKHGIANMGRKVMQETISPEKTQKG
jgi:hypothetical protein